MHERAVDPERQLGIGGCVGASSLEAPRMDSQAALDEGVLGPHAICRGTCLGKVPEGDREGRLQGGPQAMERIVSEVAVIGHGGSHEWMGQLEQQRGGASHQEDPFAPDPPNGRGGPEQARISRPTWRKLRQVQAERRPE